MSPFYFMCMAIRRLASEDAELGLGSHQKGSTNLGKSPSIEGQNQNQNGLDGSTESQFNHLGDEGRNATLNGPSESASAMREMGH